VTVWPKGSHSAAVPHRPPSFWVFPSVKTTRIATSDAQALLARLSPDHREVLALRVVADLVLDRKSVV
jgi:hypothetical protein